MITTDDILTKIIPAVFGGGLYKLVDHILARRNNAMAKRQMNNKEFMKASQGAARREMFRRINALEKLVLVCQRKSNFWERKYNQVHDQLVELRADYKIILNKLSVREGKV